MSAVLLQRELRPGRVIGVDVVLHQPLSLLVGDLPRCRLLLLLGRDGIPYHLAVDETVILLHPPLPSAGLSIAMKRERPQNDRTLVNS